MSLEQQLIDAFASSHPAQAATEIQGLPVPEAQQLLLELGEEARPSLLAWMSPHFVARCVAALDPQQVSAVIRDVRSEVSLPILRQLDPRKAAEAVDRLPRAKRAALRPLLTYPPGCAGAVMDPDVLTVSDELTVRQAIDQIQAEPRYALYYAYVLGTERRLVGVLTLRELLLGRPTDSVTTVMTREVSSLPALASWETVVSHPSWDRIHALPVTDESRFVGVVRYEALRRLEKQLEEANAGDISAETGAALAGLYGIGLRAFFGWTTALTRDSK